MKQKEKGSICEIQLSPAILFGILAGDVVKIPSKDQTYHFLLDDISFSRLYPIVMDALQHRHNRETRAELVSQQKI